VVVCKKYSGASFHDIFFRFRYSAGSRPLGAVDGSFFVVPYFTLWARLNYLSHVIPGALVLFSLIKKFHPPLFTIQAIVTKIAQGPVSFSLIFAKLHLLYEGIKV